MAKPFLITVKLLQDFANWEAGSTHELSPDLAARLLERGVAERCDAVEPPAEAVKATDKAPEETKFNNAKKDKKK